MNNLGILYCTLNKPADALPLFKGAHAISPKETDFMNNIGAVYGNLGQPDSAIWWFERVLEVQPTNTVALNFLDFTWRNKGEVAKADEYKRRAEAAATRKGVASF
jgi:Tfp pilus assembly protein PilF